MRFKNIVFTIIFSLLIFLGLNSNLFAIKPYALYSETYKGLHFDSLHPPDPDGGYLMVVNTANNTSVSVSNDNYIEGTESLAVTNPSSFDQHGGEIRFIFLNSGDDDTLRYSKVKDVSAYKFIRFNINNITNGTTSEILCYLTVSTSPDVIAYTMWNTKEIPIDGQKPELALAKGFGIDIQNKGWKTIAISTNAFYDIFNKPVDLKYFSDIHFKSWDSIATNDTTYYIDNLVFVSTAIASSMQISSSGITVPRGLKKVFTADGYDGSGNIVAINPPKWQIQSGLSGGSITSNARNEAMFTAPDAEVTGQITASTNSIVEVAYTSYSYVSQNENLSASANVTVSTVTWNSRYIIYDDFPKGADVYVTSGSVTSCIFSSDTDKPSDLTTSTRSLKMSYNLSYSTSWAGIFFQDTAPVNMATYFSTTTAILSFWVKTSTDLQVVIVSTQNYDYNYYKSKFRLSDYGVTCDGTWQKVRIILDNFYQRDKDLNFSSMTVLFGLSAIGSISGIGTARTFYVDDIMWETPDTIPATFNIALKKISDNSTTSYLTWPESVLGSWHYADEYIEINVENYSTVDWGVQIYTDNTAPDANPQWNTIARSTATSNCAGLLGIPYGGSVSTSTVALPMCWRITDSTVPVSELAIVEVNNPTTQGISLSTSTGNTYFMWNWIKDRCTSDNPNTSLIDEKFTDGQDAVGIYKSNKGIQAAENTYEWFRGPNCIYIGANFTSGATQRTYKTNKLVIELYNL
jgi:hypothetical protein